MHKGNTMKDYAATHFKVNYEAISASSLLPAGLTTNSSSRITSMPSNADCPGSELFYLSGTLLMVLTFLSFLGILFLTLLICFGLLWWCHSLRGGAAEKASRSDDLWLGLFRWKSKAECEDPRATGLLLLRETASLVVQSDGNGIGNQASIGELDTLQLNSLNRQHDAPRESDHLLGKHSSVEGGEVIVRSRRAQGGGGAPRMSRFYDTSLVENDEEILRKGSSRSLCSTKDGNNNTSVTKRLCKEKEQDNRRVVKPHPIPVLFSPRRCEGEGRVRHSDESLSDSKSTVKSLLQPKDDKNQVVNIKEPNRLQATDVNEQAILDIAENSGYQPIRCVGRGSFSSVYFVKRKSDGCLFAMKHIAFKDSKGLRRAMNEFELLNSVQGHPNIVKVAGMFMNYETGSRAPPNVSGGDGGRMIDYTMIDRSSTLSPSHQQRQSTLFKPFSTVLFNSQSSAEYLVTSEKVLHSAVAHTMEPPTTYAAVRGQPLASEQTLEIAGKAALQPEFQRVSNYVPSHHIASLSNCSANTAAAVHPSVDFMPLASSAQPLNTNLTKGLDADKKSTGVLKIPTSLSFVQDAAAVAPSVASEESVLSKITGREEIQRVEDQIPVIEAPSPNNISSAAEHDKSLDKKCNLIDKSSRNIVGRTMASHQLFSDSTAATLSAHNILCKDASPTTRSSYAPRLVSNAALSHEARSFQPLQHHPARPKASATDGPLPKPYWSQLSMGTPAAANDEGYHNAGDSSPREYVFNSNITESLGLGSKQLSPEKSKSVGLAGCGVSLSGALAPFDEVAHVPAPRMNAFLIQAAESDAEVLRTALDPHAVVHYTNFALSTASVPMPGPMGILYKPREPQSPIFLKRDARTNTLVNPYLLKGQAEASKRVAPLDAIASTTPQSIKPNDNAAVARTSYEYSNFIPKSPFGCFDTGKNNYRNINAGVKPLVNGNQAPTTSVVSGDLTSGTSVPRRDPSMGIEEAIRDGCVELCKEHSCGNGEKLRGMIPSQTQKFSPDARDVEKRTPLGRVGEIEKPPKAPNLDVFVASRVSSDDLKHGEKNPKSETEFSPQTAKFCPAKSSTWESHARKDVYHRPSVDPSASVRAPSVASPLSRRPSAGSLCLLMEYYPLGDLCHYTLRVGKLMEVHRTPLSVVALQRGRHQVAAAPRHGGGLIDPADPTFWNPFTESQLISVAYQIAAALCLLHRTHPPTVHRDLKPENILIGADARRLVLQPVAAAGEGQATTALCEVGDKTEENDPDDGCGAAQAAAETPAGGGRNRPRMTLSRPVPTQEDAKQESKPQGSPSILLDSNPEARLDLKDDSWGKMRIMNRIIPISLTDFGLATQEVKGRSGVLGVGTKPYISPEAWCGETSTTNDIWSFGCLLYALATGRLTARTARIMYRDSTHDGFASMIMNDIIERKYSLAFASFVLSLLTVNPLKRPTAAAALLCFRVQECEIVFDMMSAFFSNVLDL